MPNRTRFYSSENLGSPIADNSYGSIIRILDGCLINGFSEQTAVSANIDGRLLTINYDSPHQYIQYQYVEISAPHQLAIAGEYRVMNLTPGSITVELPTEVDSILEGVIKTRLRPLGWECPFSSDVANAPGGGRRAYRSANTDLEVRPYLRVVDDLDPLDQIEWIKFARVGMVEDLTDIDTMIGQQVPYDPEYPNRVWETQVIGANTYRGDSIWLSATRDYSDNTYLGKGMTHKPSDGIRQFLIIGTSDFFILLIRPNNLTSGYWPYMFGQLDDIVVPNDINACLLSAMNVSNVTNAMDIYYYKYMFPIANYPLAATNDSRRGYIWKNIKGTTNQMCPLALVGNGSYSGHEYTSNTEPQTNYLQFQKVFIRDVDSMSNINMGHVRGTLPIVNFLRTSQVTHGDYVISGGHVYMVCSYAISDRVGFILLDLGAL